MLALKLFSVILLGSFLGCTSEAVENVAEPDFAETLEPRSKYIDDLGHRGGKRQKHKSPNVHIENIYIPQQVQKGDETVRNPQYPVYTYPLAFHYEDVDTRKKAPKRKPQSKPKPSPTEIQLPEEFNQLPQQPIVIYSQGAAGQGNSEYITLPNTGILSQQSQGFPYFVIINSPLQQKSQQPVNKPNPVLVEENEEDIEEEEDDTEAEKPIIAEEIKKPTTKSSSHLKRSRPQLGLSQLDDSTGLTLAKYLMGQRAVQGMERSVERKNDSSVSETAAEDEEAGDEDEEASQESERHTGTRNNDKIQAEVDDSDAFQRFQDVLNSRGNKLPLEFILGSKRPSGKIDDRVALVFLRHSKRGRQLLFAEK